MAVKNEFDFSPEIRAAFDAYPQPRPSRGFETRFWANYEERRGRYHGVIGGLRRLLEIEIEGVAVWHLMASTLSGGAFCALGLGLLLSLNEPKQIPAAPLPQPDNPMPTAAMSAFAFYNREWENEFIPKPRPKTAPLRPTKEGGEISWNGLSARLA